MQFTPDFLAHFPAYSEMLARLMHALTCMDPTSSETMFAVIPTRGHAALPHKIVTGNDLSIHLLHKNPTAGPGPRAHFSSSFLDGQSLMSRLGRFRSSAISLYKEAASSWWRWCRVLLLALIPLHTVDHLIKALDTLGQHCLVFPRKAYSDLPFKGYCLPIAIDCKDGPRRYDEVLLLLCTQCNIFGLHRSRQRQPNEVPTNHVMTCLR